METFLAFYLEYFFVTIPLTGLAGASAAYYWETRRKDRDTYSSHG
jgi:hypothetical protein